MPGVLHTLKMVFVDDESLQPITNTGENIAQYMIPNRVDDSVYEHLPTPSVRTLTENDDQCVVSNHIHKKCSAITDQFKCLAPQCKWDVPLQECVPKCECRVQSELLTRCGRISHADTCDHTDGCVWDIARELCAHNETFFKGVVWSGLVIPFSYLVCYWLFNKGQIGRVWNTRVPMHICYLISVFLTSCAVLYLIYSVYHMRKYQNTRYTYAKPLLTLFVGAVCLPIFRLLWITRDYSKYWIFCCLFTTSAGLIWFMSKYFKNANASRDRLGMISMYYSIFHIVLLDNFIWWWLLFVDSSK